MRLSSATLLLSGISSALLVSAAPVLVRISFIGNDIKPVREQDDFFRYARLGAAAAAGRVPTLEDNDETDLDRLHAALARLSSMDPDVSSSNNDSPVGIVRNRTPMRPELEFTPEQLAPVMRFAHNTVTICTMPSLWERMVGRINNFFVDFLGLPEESRRTQCTTQNATGSQSVQRPPIYAPSGVISASVFPSDTPFYRNGAPATTASPSPPYRPWGRPWRQRPKSFTRRLQRALYALSPWEGRAVAFVMGCGLGVLLRMVFVFIVLGVRFLGSRKSHIATALCGTPYEDEEEEENEKEGEAVMMLVDDEEVEGVVLFDAGSLKGASMEDLPLYEEKQ